MRFSFGKNWQSYAEKALTPERIAAAEIALSNLLEETEPKDRKFIDIGFGQGLSAHLASRLGAKVTAVDIDDDNLAAAENTRKATGVETPLDLRIGSILENETLEDLKKDGPYDIVHSWGVLHHTGNMKLAVENACSLVADNGFFVSAIYNRHWSSLPWLWIKWFYNVLPSFGQQLMVALFYPIIYLAKWAVTGKNPKDKMRGMDFFYDVIDWVGGYPYEYASIEEFKALVEPLGFKCIKEIDANVPTGCNEMVFKKV
jgi:SAM-dependent methyltransferase